MNLQAQQHRMSVTLPLNSNTLGAALSRQGTADYDRKYSAQVAVCRYFALHPPPSPFTTVHRKYNEDLFESTKMTFGEHLEELRRSLIKATLALVIGF